jgi:hypothetical protein
MLAITSRASSILSCENDSLSELRDLQVTPADASQRCNTVNNFPMFYGGI